MGNMRNIEIRAMTQLSSFVNMGICVHRTGLRVNIPGFRSQFHS